MQNNNIISQLPPDSSKQLIQSIKPNGIDISFQNIHYSVKTKNTFLAHILPSRQQNSQKPILKGVTGIFKAGKVTAIMGASGAGKTTLLNILSCRIKSQKQGKLFANNLQYSYQNFGNFANYVMQHDLLMQTMTVRQTLEFAAKLKLKLNDQQIKEKVLQISKRMKLQKCLDTLVGGVILKGISGGQRKRTSIAYELISDPQVLFLDQPTSGLDSLTSFIICSELKKLASLKNKTIVMTIHQPNSQTYQLFDDLLLLVDGKVIYQNQASKVVQYFEQKFSLTCTQHMNAPDFFMSKVHHQDKQNVQRYPLYFQAYQNYQKNNIDKKIIQKQNTEVVFRVSEVKGITALSALFKRALINSARNPRLIQTKFIQAIFMALFIGGIFFGDGNKSYVQNHSWYTITGFLFFVSIFSMTMSISPISLTFPQQRLVFMKQQDSKMYTTTQYFISKNLIEIPEHIIIPLITCSIYYFMVSLAETGGQFFLHWVIFCLMSFCGASIGLFLGSIVSDEKDVGAIIALILLPLITFSGFFKNRKDLSPWFGWIQYISPNKYSFIGLLENQVAYKDSFISDLHFDVSKWEAIGILICIGITFRILSLFFLWLLRKKTQ